MTENKDSISYQSPVGPSFTVAILSIMFGGGIAVFVETVLSGGPWPFVLLWLLVVAWLAFGFLYLTCHVVVVRDDKVLWRTLFRHGDAPITHLSRVTAWPGGSIHVYRFEDGQKARVQVMQGYFPFLNELHVRYPEIELPSSAYARFVEGVRLVPHQSREEDSSDEQK